nr:MAG TPA: hypothetical protein [Caudoviricetes sp.]
MLCICKGTRNIINENKKLNLFVQFMLPFLSIE